MKFLFFSFVTLLSIHFLPAQVKHEVSIQSGFYNNGVIRFTSLDGAASFDHQNSFSLGIGYQYNFSTKYSFKLPFNWQSNKLTGSSIGASGEGMQEDINLSTINIPILFSINLNNYFFIDAGPVLHFETENSPQGYLDKQNGIGFALGAGLQYQILPLTIFAKPTLQLLSLLPFDASDYHERIFSRGIVIGVSYGL
ncbi:hypothetical protein GCM10011506_27230 [Marivirga lumbricoides]|uniref:Outer membrane protein beta-barrel domain-containing protein n=1 Tax=Marivirga lumbricoides TaxID=1046115 RepID=A0ABQ1MNI2_9BACT|nr:hypothetical protein GCM10011506_27230 [Marivirga lumbricoides]